MNRYNAVKNKYLENLTTRNNGLDFFTYMKSIKNQATTLPNTMSYKAINYTGDERYVQMARHLSSCFTPPTMLLPNDPNEQDLIWNDFHRTNYSPRNEHCWTTYINEIDEGTILWHLQHLNIKKGKGYHDIDAKFFFNYSQQLVHPIYHLFNGIMSTGSIPRDWKENIIVPIPKTGARNRIENYRGICMQSVLVKIFDKIITKMVNTHLGQKIHDYQHGFRTGRDTSSNLLELDTSVAYNLKARTQTDIIYIDLAKAFDRINHEVLARKLCLLSCPLQLFKVIMCFVTGRHYHLFIEGRQTECSFEAGSSVPQGSCIGPLLFNIYVNDLEQIFTESDTNLLQFADDSKFYRQIEDHTHMLALQDKLNLVSEWCAANKVSINPAKSYAMSVADRYTKRVETFYFINGQRIKQIQCHKDLGVTFDSTWSFEQQYKDTQRKSRMFTYFGYQLCKQTGSRETINKVFQVYNLPIIDYCSPIWNINGTKHAKFIEPILHNVSRLVLNKPRLPMAIGYQSYPERIKSMRTITLDDRRVIELIILGCRIMRNELKTNVKHIFNQAVYDQPVTLRSPPLFTIRGIPEKSAIGRIMEVMNKYKTHINFALSTDVQRARLINAFVTSRQAIR